MKNAVPQYTFYKTKYGSELLIDVVELEYAKKVLTRGSVHTLTYYDITFITEGEGIFSIDNQIVEAIPGDVFFSKPGEIRNWDTEHITNGYALIFEDEFLSSFFKDSLFVQHLPYFNPSKTARKLHLPDKLYSRILQLLRDVKAEIDVYLQNDVHVLRALLFEVLMMLNRAYLNSESTLTESKEATLTESKEATKEAGKIHLDKFIQTANAQLKEQHSVQYYADKLCITPNYLNEIVSSALNISAKQYIRNKVMDEAKRLLIYTHLPIAEIASELNFSTVSYFIRSFRQYTKETPLSYRQAHKP